MKIPVWMLRVRFIYGRLRYRMARGKWPCNKCSRPDLCRIVATAEGCLRPQLPGDVQRAVRAVEKRNSAPPALALYGNGKPLRDARGTVFVQSNVRVKGNGAVDFTLKRLYPKRPAGVSSRQWDKQMREYRRKQKALLERQTGQSTTPRVSDEHSVTGRRIGMPGADLAVPTLEDDCAHLKKHRQQTIMDSRNDPNRDVTTEPGLVEAECAEARRLAGRE